MTDDPVGWGKVAGGAPVPATHLGWTAGLAVLEVKAIACWGQHLGLYSLGFELKPLRNKAVAKSELSLSLSLLVGTCRGRARWPSTGILEPLPLSRGVPLSQGVPLS